MKKSGIVITLSFKSTVFVYFTFKGSSFGEIVLRLDISERSL